MVRPGHEQRWRALLDRSPRAVAVAALVAVTGFVLLRLVVAADGDITRFVVAGSAWTDAGTGVARQHGGGYDGQFAFRSALAPYDLARTSRGVTYDSPLRLQRLTYPLLAFLLAAGRPAAVPYALVLVNVLAFAFLALLAATLARDSGRPAWAGLLLCAPLGVAISIGRDLTEVVTACLLVGGLLAWRRDRRGWALLAFTGAVLSREPALLLYGAFAGGELVAMTRASGRPRLRLLAGCAVPVLAFVTWQLVCWAAVGRVPLLVSGGKNAVLPGMDLLPAAAGWLRDALRLDVVAAITVGQLAALLVLVVAAGTRLRTAAVGERIAWGAALLLFLSLSQGVWRGPADFRTATELQVLSGVVLLRSPGRLRLAVLPVLVACALTAVVRVLKV
jgi:hypothetical protein